MKKSLFILSICLVVLLLSSLMTVNAEEAKKITIGEIIYNLSQPYQQAHAKNAEEYAKELGINIIIVDGKGSTDVAASAFEDLIAKKVDGIITQPADGESVNNSIKEAHNAGIPVVTFFNKPTKEKAPFVLLVEHDIAVQMGAFAAKKWMELYPDKPIRIGLISEPSVEYTRVHRALAFVDGVKSVAPEAEVVADLNGYGVRDKSLLAGEDLLQSHPDVNIIYGINADSVLGALGAFEAAGRGKAENGKPLTEIFLGTDGTEAEILKIADPNSSFKVTMALQPKNNARVLIDTLLKVIKGEIDMKSDIVVDSPDFIVDGWSMDIDKLQKFLEDQYFSKINIKKELGL